MTMKIDKRLNIVLTVQRETGGDIHVHSMPISREIYEAHFLLLSKTISSMYSEGLPYGTCCRVAMLMLKRIADELDGRDPNGVPVNRQAVDTFLAEVWRLTNVAMLTDTGWQTRPFQQAMTQMDPEDVAEVQNYLVFFTAASRVHKMTELSSEKPPGMYVIWRASGAVLTPLTVTEYANSLPISMPAENTGVKPTA